MYHSTCCQQHPQVVTLPQRLSYMLPEQAPHVLPRGFVKVHIYTGRCLHQRRQQAKGWKRHCSAQALSTHEFRGRELSTHVLPGHELSTHALSTHVISPHVLSTHMLSTHVLSTHELLSLMHFLNSLHSNYQVTSVRYTHALFAFSRTCLHRTAA